MIVTTFEEYPEVRQTVRFYRNKLETVGNYAVVTLSDPMRTGATGALVTQSGESGAVRNTTRAGEPRTNVFALVSGESYRTQLPLRQHVGLGTNSLLRMQMANTNFVVKPGLVVRDPERP